MEDYKLLIVFEDIEDDAIIHAIGDIERIILSEPHGSVYGIEKLKSQVWQLSFRSPKKAVKAVCDDMLTNLNIQHHYIASRC